MAKYEVKFRQIAVSPGGVDADGKSSEQPDVLYGLDNNGRVWTRMMQGGESWHRLPMPESDTADD